MPPNKPNNTNNSKTIKFYASHIQCIHLLQLLFEQCIIFWELLTDIFLAAAFAFSRCRCRWLFQIFFYIRIYFFEFSVSVTLRGAFFVALLSSADAVVFSLNCNNLLPNENGVCLFRMWPGLARPGLAQVLALTCQHKHTHTPAYLGYLLGILMAGVGSSLKSYSVMHGKKLVALYMGI